MITEYSQCCLCFVSKKRPPTKSYVEILESRLQKMEELVDRLQPQSKSPAPDPEPRVSNNSPRPSPAEQSSSPTASTPAVVVVPTFSSPSPPASAELEPSDDEMETTRKLIHSFKKFSIRSQLPMRYYGKSSNLMLLQTAVDMKMAYSGMDSAEFRPEPTDNMKSFEDECAFSHLVVPDDLPLYTDFPEPDLMEKLVEAYFADIHPYVPVLHRQTFERDLTDGLHLRDEGFGAVVLLRYVLMSIYAGSYGSPHTCWTILGVGLRAAQDVGIHRQKTYQSMSKTDAELWKRAFWCLLTLDRHLGFGLGRPSALQDEDFDVEPLAECDDEYWFTGDPETDFKQPPGKPSRIAYMNCLARLLQILAFASRTIYSINKSKLLMGFVGHEWEEQIVAELDSALNRWIDTVPDHLRWDPHREDIGFLNQSAALYAKYYQMQIMIHRPFLPTNQKTESSRLSFPSLAICTNAARSCVHISDVQYKRAGKPLSLKLNRISLFLAGVVLLINMWAGKKAGLANRSAAEDVQKCLKMLQEMEPYSHVAGKFWQILNALYSAGDFKTSESDGASSRKRPRDADAPEDLDGRHYAPAASINPENVVPVQQHGATHGHPARTGSDSMSDPSPTATDSPASFDLPVHTEDLGRIPFEHGFSPSLFAPGPDAGMHAQQTQSQPQTQAQLPGGGPSYMQTFPENMDAASLPQTSAFVGGGGGAGFDNHNSFPQLAQASLFDFSQVLQQQQPSLDTYVRQQQQQQQPAGPDLGEAATMGMPGFSMDVLADNTLEMWSSAPTSMDWADWGAFINNVSGGGTGEGVQFAPSNTDFPAF
ncbi:hypothetical protein BN946_scf184449.g4 [Trametes cinnabarina]|uniref:Xylanolytic transcriptional activator regulatory domain-containing protein n=1 Tax=Pycnoporus cinnabarinus TaxID=5643 RepID=A0A060SQ55_PYCCI|nr:hypothetical protein BN946_scf184449.g4 [Trametes cinnabarina]